jgi:Protein of unknown function (DUF1761)
MGDISWLGVLIAAVALFVLAAIWYTALFGKAYRQELGVPEPSEGEPLKAPPVKELGGQFVAGLVIAVALAWLIGASTAVDGTKVGLAGGVVVAASLGQFHLFEGKSIRHLLINVGYILLGLTVVGAILGAFQAV